MGSYYRSWQNYTQTSSENLKIKAENFISNKTAEGVSLFPIKLANKTIAKSWWGKSWCNSLESYADYFSRLERGRKYIRANCIVDLQIDSCLVNALVIGSSSKPYKVKIRIDQLDEEQISNIKEKCFSKIQNMEDLINGDFPNELKDLFMQKGIIFPTFKEIHFGCSCPDVADMCKHVAAVLYGIGARFDSDPLLFFKLRGIDTENIISTTIQSHIEKMLDNATATSSRIIDDNNISSIFGL